MGSRLGYLGTLLPKTMVPVHGRPLLWYALRALSELGAREVVVATLGSDELVLGYLRSLDLRSVRLDELRSHKLVRPTRSPVETLLAALPQGEQDLAVVAGDSMISGRNLGAFADAFHRTGAEVGNLVVREPHRDALQRACEVDLAADGRIRGIREKPKHPVWKYRGCATYLFRRDSFPRMVKEVGTKTRIPGLTDLVAWGAHRGTALGFVLEGWEVNVNTVKDVVDSWKHSDPSLGAVL